MKSSLNFLLALAVLASCTKTEKNADPQDSTQLSQAVRPALVVAVGKVEPEKEIILLAAPIGGVVKTVYKTDGAQVQAGEPLVQLNDDLEQSRMMEIRMQVEAQRAQVTLEQLQLNEVQSNLENKNQLLAKTKRLVETGAEAQQVLDDLVTQVNVLEINFQKSKASIQLATQKLNQLQAQLNTSRLEAQQKQFKAPYAGTVLDLQVASGEAVTQFSTYAEFAPSGKLVVRAEVDELFSDQVQAGQHVDIVATGSNAVLATGDVVVASPYLKKKSLFSEKSDDQEDRRVREVKIALRDGHNLIINAKVECQIKL